jgi:four helix bundle protein
MYSSLPKSVEAQVLGKQVLRSGTSVGANYHEACRGRSKAEFLAKMGDCLKELDETKYWFELLTAGGILSENKLSGLLRESRELTAIFVTIIKKTKSNLGKK